MKIEYLNIINDYLTAVYYTRSLGWRYTIILKDGSLFQPYDLYETSSEAYEVAKNVIHLVVSCDRESKTSL